MVNLDIEKQWKQNHDLAKPSKEFNQVMESLQIVFSQSQDSTCSKEVSVRKSDIVTDVIEVREGYIEYIRPESQNIDFVLDIEMGQNPDVGIAKTACELAIVLDVSGSMRGTPLEYSKQAIIQVIDRLGENDYLHFVTYSTSATLRFKGFMTKSDKLEAKKIILDVQVEGSTNIVSGIQSAIESMFSDSMQEEKPNSKRMFLFTDGCVNSGVQNHNEIGAIVGAIHFNFGVNCTAFGFGVNFDEALMRLIASMGKGDYFHIDGVEDLSYKINKGLDLLQSLFAINAKLNIFTINSEQANVMIGSIHGYSDIPGSAAQASLGDLCFEDLRQILCSLKLEYKGITTETPNAIEILQYNLSYMMLEADGSFVEQSLNGNISIKFSSDEALLGKIPDSLVVASTIKQANATDKEILKCLNNHQKGKALELAKGNLELLQSIQNIDQTGVVVHLISRAKDTITKIKTESQSAKIAKHVGYSNYRASIVHRKCF